MLDPTDRVVMVSGAARGIGRAVVERLLADGFRVSAGVRSSNLVPSDRLLVHRYDAESLASAEAWRDATLARFGALHGLVNAAGILLPGATLDDADETALDTMWQINVKGPMRLIRLMLPALKQGGDGRVINVSSLSGKRVANANIGYAMSKFAPDGADPRRPPRRLGPRRARHRDLPRLRRDGHGRQHHRAPAREHDPGARPRRADRNGAAAAGNGKRRRTARQLPPGELRASSEPLYGFVGDNGAGPASA
ncbi:MAG: SDR family NAD(P)-dependent oxidoreductase [Acetobacteraceae bacterium]